MPKALAVALLLSACLPAAARGFFFTSGLIPEGAPRPTPASHHANVEFRTGASANSIARPYPSASSEPDSTWWAAAHACTFREDSSAELRLAAGLRMDSLLAFALTQEGDPVKALPTPPPGVLRVVSTDQKLVAYSFAVPQSGGSYRYFGMVHARVGKATTLTRLTDAGSLDAQGSGDDGTWPGGLIYALGESTYRRTSRYVALMFRPHAREAQQKWIEPWVLGRPSAVAAGSTDLPRLPLYFGARIFSVKDFAGEHFTSPPKRLILRYAPEVSASLRFGKNGGEILVDEVAPMRHGRPGDFKTYGPTLAVDRLYFERGKWVLAPVENP